MKSFIIILILFFFSNFCKAQNLVAIYDVQRDVMGAPEGVSLPPLSLTGYYYKKNNTIISFLKADYLKLYPEAIIEIKELNHVIGLDKDTIQAIFYVDLDSLIFRYRISYNEDYSQNNFFYFDKDARNWEISDKTETINGFLCTYAVQYNSSRNILAEIWFANDFPIMPIGMLNLLNVPGLIVKAKFTGTRETYTLKEFSTFIEPNEDILWPKQFNERFHKKNDLRKLR